MKMYKWDPIWGVNNKIFFLGAKFEKDKPFFYGNAIYIIKIRLYFHHQGVQDYVREVFIKINFLEVSPMII